VVGEPGSGKSEFCKGLLTSDRCMALSNLTGLLSGYNDGTGDDHSLLARGNRRCWITSEADTMVSDPGFAHLMGQFRKVFDGSLEKVFRNKKENVEHHGLRTPWIMAGTPSGLLNMNQASLGDRFLKVRLWPPDEGTKQSIVMRAIRAELTACRIRSNGRAEGNDTPEAVQAYRLTGGWVDHLFQSSDRLIGALAKHAMPKAEAECAALACFVADMRSRPTPLARFGQEHEWDGGKETPARLGRQFIRLACCLAAVMGRESIDGDVLRIVGKVAWDTASGKTLEVVKRVSYAGVAGIDRHHLAIVLHVTEDSLNRWLAHLRKTDVVRCFRPRTVAGATRTRWVLTDRFQELWQAVAGARKGD